MKQRARTAHLALLTLFAVGCSPSSYLDKIEAEYDEIADMVCGCLPSDQQTQCQELSSSPYALFGRDCLEDALNKDKKASRKTLKCTLDQAKKYKSCVEEKLRCEDPASYQACEVPDSDACPQLPAEVETAIAACFSDAI
ncbi:MAG TPA: hypothetical protein VIK91_22120 [Nannocystis sp.]